MLLLLACANLKEPVDQETGWPGVAEDCTSGADDDGDGRVDCEDGDCWGQAACPELSFTIDDGEAEWFYQYDHYFEDRNWQDRFEVFDARGQVRRRTFSGTTTCSFELAHLGIVHAASQYGGSSRHVVNTGWTSSGACGVTGSVFDQARFSVDAMDATLRVSEYRWLSGSHTWTSFRATSTSSGLGHESTFSGRGPVYTLTPWVLRPF